MPPTLTEQIKYRIMELEVYVAMMRNMPEDKLWVEDFARLLEEKLGRLKADFGQLSE